MMSIELDRQSCWWWGDYPYDIDIDDPNQSDRDEYYYEHYLKTTKEPIVLFDNGHWRTESQRAKYETMVSTVIGEHTLIKVSKTEYRYARE
jgi:hypothetical protein